MKRLGGTLRNERPAAPGPVAVVDDAAWGFHAIDGLPDLEETPGVGPGLASRFTLPRLSNGSAAPGLGVELTDELAWYRARREAEVDGPVRELTVYELAVADALTARRDAAVRLATVLADDLSTYDGVMVGVLDGRATDILDPDVGGVIRRTVSDAMAQFEAARHRFRLALVAVAVDNGMTAAQIGEAFTFSRQLASRYLQEAREQWPELADRTSPLAPPRLTPTLGATPAATRTGTVATRGPRRRSGPGGPGAADPAGSGQDGMPCPTASPSCSTAPPTSPACSATTWTASAWPSAPTGPTTAPRRCPVAGPSTCWSSSGPSSR